MITRQHLQNAFLDSEFILPCAYVFYSNIDINFDCCFGDTKVMGFGLVCQPISLGNKGKSLLISLTDTKNRTWYAWFHADEKA